jgi:hypothetical protein
VDFPNPEIESEADTDRDAYFSGKTERRVDRVHTSFGLTAESTTEREPPPIHTLGVIAK